MRSELQTEEKLTLEIDLRLKETVEDAMRDYERINEPRFAAGHVPIFDPLVHTASLTVMQCVAFAYTRGDTLESIDNDIMQPSVENLLQACGEIRHRDALGKSWFWGGQKHTHFGDGLFLGVNQMLSIFTLYSWFLCFGTPKNKVEELSNFVTPEGVSSSVDTVIKHFQTDRSIGDNNSEKNPLFDIWVQMFTLEGDEQIAVIKDYLNKWAKYLSKNKKGPVAAYATLLGLKHNSNKTLPKELERGEHVLFYGFWAWEVALAVKLFKIDDSEFRDHPLYPVDAVDYIKS